MTPTLFDIPPAATGADCPEVRRLAELWDVLRDGPDVPGETYPGSGLYAVFYVARDWPGVTVLRASSQAPAVVAARLLFDAARECIGHLLSDRGAEAFAALEPLPLAELQASASLVGCAGIFNQPRPAVLGVVREQLPRLTRSALNADYRQHLRDLARGEARWLRECLAANEYLVSRGNHPAAHLPVGMPTREAVESRIREREQFAAKRIDR